jgi:hypothetical protein
MESLRALKRLLDEAVHGPGTSLRFGWDPRIGLIPWAGDALTALLSCGIVLQAPHLRQPLVVEQRMLFNVAIDLIVGAVPLFGDAADFFWKANTRNFALLERHVELRANRAGGGPAGSSATAGDWLFVCAVIAAIVAIALVPLFVMYWLLNGLRPYLPAFAG